MTALPSKALLRRGDICRHYGLTKEEFTDLVSAGVFRPVYIPVPKADMLPRWRRRRLPKRRYAHFRREDVLAAETSGRIAAS